MKTSDKIKIEMSQARERLAVFAAKDDATDDEKKERAALMTEWPELEARYQAALLSEDEEDAAAQLEDPDGELDAESKEFHEKIAPKASAADYLLALKEGKGLAGETKEFNEALGQTAGIKQTDDGLGLDFPLYMLDPGEPVDGENAEYAATSLSLDLIRRGNAWLNRIFLDSASTALGVTRRMVPKGSMSYATITGGVSPATTAAGTAKDEETLTARSLELEPRSIRGGYQITTRDLFRLGDMYNAAITADLRGAMTQAMDSEIVNGKSGEIDGFLGDSDISKRKLNGTSDGAQTGESTAAHFTGAAFGFVDGKYAADSKDVSVLVSPEVYTWAWQKALSIGSTDHVFLLPWLEDVAGVKFTASDQLSAITGSQYYSIFCLARGKAGSAIHAMWDNAMIVMDRYGTNRTSGYESFYILGHHDFGLLRHEIWALRRTTAA